MILFVAPESAKQPALFERSEIFGKRAASISRLDGDLSVIGRPDFGCG
jgi:hypothetical protein